MISRKVQMKRQKRKLLQKARKAAGITRKPVGTNKPSPVTKFNKVAFKANETAGDGE